MPQFEYKVVPAPTRGQKAKGVRSAEARFAFSVETVLNQMGAEGWEYVRAELLPSEERAGLTSTTTTWRNVLVFRRPRAAADSAESAQTETAVPVAATAAAPLVASLHQDPPENAPRIAEDATWSRGSVVPIKGSTDAEAPRDDDAPEPETASTTRMPPVI